MPMRVVSRCVGLLAERTREGRESGGEEAGSDEESSFSNILLRDNIRIPFRTLYRIDERVDEARTIV